MRLSPILRRLYGPAEAAGVDLMFSTALSELIYEDGRIGGAKVEQGGEVSEIKTRLVVDTSGIGAVVRTSLPKYRRPPYSVVGDAFICLGDNACLTNPFSGKGITSGWTLCKIAVHVVDEALRSGEYVTARVLRKASVRYFRDQGAGFAGIPATVPSAANATREENSYLFLKDEIFSQEDLIEMNRDFEVRVSQGKILKILSALVIGMFTGNYSPASFKALLRSVLVSGKIRSHWFFSSRSLPALREYPPNEERSPQPVPYRRCPSPCRLPRGRGSRRE